jgi:hypothetical protein
MLEAGVDALTVSTLLGHADGTMLARVYSHLAKRDAYLREALRAPGGRMETDIRGNNDPTDRAEPGVQ